MGAEVVKTITVLLACYQGEKHLPEQLASLAAQDDTAFRVLMQDDGSEDGTMQLLRDIAAQDSRFILAAHHGRHFGAKGNFWSLLAQADTPYVAFCDQDDIWQPDRLSACRAAIEQAERECGEDTPILVHSDCTLIDGQGNVLHESFFAHQGWDPAATTLPRLLVQNNVTGCTALFNRALCRAALETGDPQKMFMHDWFMALLAASTGRVVFVAKPLVRYRQHGKNVMGASRSGLIARGVKALGAYKRGQERIALTYRHASDFRTACGSLLPDEACTLIDRYLATKHMTKIKRVLTVRRLGCTMQSTVTRIGQIIFG